ncbi:uncharacterized protein [Eurosta solidaginis]|uniref:uncharacterized protein n=1 Tax=Eurosta solidaginis TaxID=178769 RepID=UPI003530B6D1
MDEIAGQKVATEQLIRQEAQSAPVTKYFPICKKQELEHLEEKITSANKDVYESAVSATLCNNMKNIKMLLNIDVINDLNMDGTHRQISLKSYPNFYSTLTGAIAKMPFK